jgi:radical SAM superfamily enzyme YgiQ (UPF0313 family)
MEPLKIYLGDLTYTTVGLATEAFPLNIGYVGAYCKECFGDQVDITLFKYIDDLEQAISDSPPDVLALSNYPWNHTLGLELFRVMRDVFPKTLCVMGGSNIPHQPDLQEKFMASKSVIDTYVYMEGEIGFSNIVAKILEGGLDREWLKQKPIPGCLFVDTNGKFVRGPNLPRRKALDEFPSPYLTGILDKFFDGKLSPMMETNRGCPFSCTFCHEGHSVYQKVNFFSTERVMAELEYIAERVPSSIHNLMLCDPNFGMYRRDLEICTSIATIQARTGWPEDIFATTGKNNKDRIATGLHKLNGAMPMWLSVQSMDQDVLDNIKRTNISLGDMMEIQSALTDNQLPSQSEIILGLPGESYTSHIESISKLVTANVDTITAYTLMLLDGTELNTPEERKKWEFKSKYRVLPRDFGQLRNGKNVVEVEEVVIGSKDLSFDEYIAMRRFHFLLSVIYNGKACASLFKLLKELDVPMFPFLKAMLERLDEAHLEIRDLMAEFERETKEELWDSEKELREFFDHDENFERLVSGEYGSNLLQKYVSLALVETPELWVSFALKVAQDIIEEQNPNPRDHLAPQFDNIQRYCLARVKNLFGTDRLTDIPKELLIYDIESWAADRSGKQLEEFLLEVPTLMKFTFTMKQFRSTEDYFERFGRSHQGLGKILTKMNIMNAWRKCLPADQIVREIDEEGREVYFALINEQASGGVFARR